MRRCISVVALAVLIISSSCLSSQIAFRETFAGGKMDATWETHCSKGNSISVQDGVVQIEADVNTFAHLSRPVNADNVTVSAKIKSSEPTGITWCTSIFLVWNGGNWCQVGMINGQSTTGYYAVETLDGATTETYLESTDLSKAHYVGIQLGKDCIRYMASDDGKDWKCVKIMDRPAQLKGSPKFLSVGKGYGRGAEPYANPFLFNDYSDRGPKVTSQVSDIRIDNTPAGALKITPAERKSMADSDLDPVGIIELQGRDDTSYEKVSKYYPPMKYPKEAVGVPEHPVDIAVDYLGRLQISYDKPLVAWLEIGDPAVAFGEEKTPITRGWLNGYIPVLTLKTTRDGVEYEQTVFGWSEGFSPDKPLYGYIRLRARALDGGKLPDTVTLVTDSGKKRTQYPLTQTQPGCAEACMKVSWPATDEVASIMPIEFSRALDDTAKFWKPILDRVSHFEVPEQRVNDAYRSWIAYSLLDVDKKAGIYEPHDGVGFYEENYGYSCTLYCIALDMYGLHDKAELYLDSILHFQEPDGLYSQNFGLPDMGTLLLAIAEHYNYTGDEEWLKRVAPNMLRASDWIIRMRANAPKEGVLKGMIKYRAYCDYATPVYDYFADTYCVIGLEEAAKVLKAIGMTEDAKRIGDEARKYRADVLASMDAATFEKNGRKYLPLEPETHRLLNDSQFTGGDYYGLVTGCLLENEFLRAKDRRSYLFTDLMEQKKGLIAGVCKFQSGGIDHAYTYGYLMTQLRRGDARKVILGFYSFLAYGMTRETYSAVECTNIVTGNNYWTLPHLYSATQQLRLLRHMILREDGDTLRIGEAIPRAWLESGKAVKADKAPTRFGEVSFTIAPVAKGISIKLTPPVRRAPKQIVITLRLPEFRPIRQVLVNGANWTRFKGETITLDGVTEPAKIEVLY